MTKKRETTHPLFYREQTLVEDLFYLRDLSSINPEFPQIFASCSEVRLTSSPAMRVVAM